MQKYIKCLGTGIQLLAIIYHCYHINLSIFARYHIMGGGLISYHDLQNFVE